MDQTDNSVRQDNVHNESSFFFGHILDKNMIPEQSTLKIIHEEDPTTQITAKSFLQAQVYPVLEQSISHLLEAVRQNGEFDKYVERLAEKQEELQREMRRREKERRRLEMGEEYETSDEDDNDRDGSSDEDSSEFESSNNSEEQEDNSGFDSQEEDEDYNSDSPSPDAKRRMRRKKRKQLQKSKESVAFNIEEQFIPLRFLGMTLKDLNTNRHNYQQKQTS
eukprot:403349907